MKALVIADAHLYKTPDGKIWTKTIYGNDFWQRYLQVFDSIDIVARMCEKNYEEVKGFLRVDGNNIDFKPMPMTRGGKAYIKHLFQIIRRARNVVEDEACAIVRLPSIIATFIYPFLLRKKIPFAIEIVANPKEGKSSFLIRCFLMRQLKNAAKRANGVSYVTQFALQKQYPSYARKKGEDNEHFEEHYSSITLLPSQIGVPKKYQNKTKFWLVHTSNVICNNEKGHSIVIRVLKELCEKKYDVEVNFIGDGAWKSYFEQMASEFGLSDRVHFIGWLSKKEEVMNVLKNSDVFIFPSVSEGLPRSLIEAMAVGLPCVASNVGGIPELLSEEYLFAPSDVTGFASAVEKFICNPFLMEKESFRNIQKAKGYTLPILQDRRNSFYSKLKKIAERKEGERM